MQEVNDRKQHNSARASLRILFFVARPNVISTLRHAVSADPSVSLHLVVDADDAAYEARRRRPDVVLIDPSVPARAGKRVVEWLRGNSALAATRVLVLGDRSRQRAEAAAAKLGADGYTPDPASSAFPPVLRALAQQCAQKSA